MRKSFRTAALAVLAVLAPPVFADEPPFCPAIDPPALLRQGFGGQAAPTPGLRAFRDPVTGRLRQPTAEEAAALARVEAEAAPERLPVFEVIIHPDGMKTVDLHGAFDAAAVATRNPDGSVTVTCVPAGAAAAAPAVPGRAAHEEK